MHKMRIAPEQRAASSILKIIRLVALVISSSLILPAACRLPACILASLTL